MKTRKLPDPMPGWKTATAVATLLVAGALLYFKAITVHDFLAIVAGGGGLGLYGLRAAIDRKAR